MKKEITEKFKEAFGYEPEIIVRSPGRINLIGEHTDYNEGFVLPAAINLAAYTAVALRTDLEINLYAVDLEEKIRFEVNDLRPQQKNEWVNYIIGVAAQFQKKGIDIPGFDLALMSNVPVGAGLSSSAALACGTAMALNELLKTNQEKKDLVLMAQKAEHEFAGVNCGVMDQFASMMGEKDTVLKLDCRSLTYEKIPFHLEGVSVLLLNTNVKHSLASTAYNQRRQECERAVVLVRQKYTSVVSLRDVTLQMLDECVKQADAVAYKRATFVVNEFLRMQEGCNQLKKNNIEALGKIMFATHEGLSKEYEVSCSELDFLANFVKDYPGVLGARMMGGGFGGCTINLVKENEVKHLLNAIEPAYKKATGIDLTHYIVSVENGTETLR